MEHRAAPLLRSVDCYTGARKRRRRGRLRRDSPHAGQCPRDRSAEDEAANVREERDATAVCLGTEEPEVRLEELVEEPEPRKNQAESCTGMITTSPRTFELDRNTK